MKLSDVIPGDRDALVLGVVAVSLLYVGTGGWSDKRWQQALTVGGPAVAWLTGYKRGFNTYNPALHVDELVKAAAPRAGDAIEDLVGDRIDNPTVSRLIAPLAGELAGAATGRAIDELRALVGDPRGIFAVGEAAGSPLTLPPGWHRDEHGHLRDEHGRYASEEAARSWRPG